MSICSIYGESIRKRRRFYFCRPVVSAIEQLYLVTNFQQIRRTNCSRSNITCLTYLIPIPPMSTIYTREKINVYSGCAVVYQRFSFILLVSCGSVKFSISAQRDSACLHSEMIVSFRFRFITLPNFIRLVRWYGCCCGDKQIKRVVKAN